MTTCLEFGENVVSRIKQQFKFCSLMLIQSIPINSKTKETANFAVVS